LENLQLGSYHHINQFKQNVEKVFQQFPILNVRKKQIAGTLSGGEQQMLSIARGLMSLPKLMMLDEPSLGLSPVLVEEVFKIITGLNKTGYTILLSEQNARKALQTAHRGYVFEAGKVVLSGKAEVLANDANVHHAYLGGRVV
jgi:branched-chain amino acid transport system ATP-binding protein